MGLSCVCGTAATVSDDCGLGWAQSAGTVLSVACSKRGPSANFLGWEASKSMFCKDKVIALSTLPYHCDTGVTTSLKRCSFSAAVKPNRGHGGKTNSDRRLPCWVWATLWVQAELCVLFNATLCIFWPLWSTVVRCSVSCWWVYYIKWWSNWHKATQLQTGRRGGSVVACD